MRIRLDVNARPCLFGKSEGISVYAEHIILRLIKRNPEAKFRLFFDRKSGIERYRAENAEAKLLFPQTRHRILWTWWFDQSLSRAVRSSDARLFYSPEGHGCTRIDAPQLITFHDLGFEHRPQDLPRSLADHYRRRSPELAHRAAAILTVSQDVRKDLIEQYELPADKIHLVSPALPDSFDLSPLKESDRSRLGDQPYFAVLGAIHPRKNPETLLKAFQLYRERGGRASLAFIGSPFRFYQDAFKALLARHPYKGEIKALGWVAESEKRILLGRSKALLFPSWFEGFGLPILEAFALGVPVLASNRTSLPEVGGDAALYAEAGDPDGWAEGMLRLEGGAPMGFEQRARRRLDAYSWDRSAGVLEDLIERYAQA